MLHINAKNAEIIDFFDLQTSEANKGRKTTRVIQNEYWYTLYPKLTPSKALFISNDEQTEIFFFAISFLKPHYTF